MEGGRRVESSSSASAAAGGRRGGLASRPASPSSLPSPLESGRLWILLFVPWTIGEVGPSPANEPMWISEAQCVIPTQWIETAK